MIPAHQLYITGGALPGDALFYVVRRDDAILQEALRRGEFCYVLTPRQMGKSSLVVQMARRLRAENIRVAVIDLQNIGLNLTLEQWYLGLLDSLGQGLSLHDELDDFVLAHENLSPLQLWQLALREVVLPNVAEPIVIFIDEIDTVRGLPFSTDEFFGAIRSLYNARAENPIYKRLTFCLLGVATPADLIQDPRLTPFNIGTRIDLHDFTFDEATQLQQGLGHDAATNRLLMERIYYWTGGHPCLTQRMCKAIAEDDAVLSADGVDRWCHRLFLTAAMQNRDDNITCVSQRMLPSEEKQRAALLSLYQQVLAGKQVRDNDADELVSALKLSGVVRAQDGFLQVRNRIYRQAFDRTWITEAMPDAEKRRQRAAYRLGLWRAVAISSVLLTLIGSLVMAAFTLYSRAGVSAKLADQKNHYVYNVDMILVQQSYDRREYGQVAQLLAAHLPTPQEKEDLRGWEWRYYWGLMHDDLHTFVHKGTSTLYGVAFSRDDKTLASSSNDGLIRFWDPVTMREKSRIDGQQGEIFCLAFCPTDANLLVSAGEDRTLKLWDVTTRHATVLLSVKTRITSMAYSPQGKYLAVGEQYGGLSILEVATHRLIAYNKMEPNPSTPFNGVNGVAFSPDGKWLAAVYADCGKVRLLSSPFQRWNDIPCIPSGNALYSVAISPDSRTLALGRWDGKSEVWDMLHPHRKFLLDGQRDKVEGLAFSPDGRTLATGSWDNTVQLWDLATHKTLRTFIGHTRQVTCTAFSHDGKLLASGAGNELKLWDPARRDTNPFKIDLPTNTASPAAMADSRPPKSFIEDELLREVLKFSVRHHDGRIYPESAHFTRATLSPDRSLVALGDLNGKVTLRNTGTGQEIAVFQVDTPSKERGGGTIVHLVFSQDGTLLATASGDPAVVKIWDIARKRQIRRFEHYNAAAGIAFAPKEKKLAIANWQGYVFLWDYSLQQDNVKPGDPGVIKWRAHTKPVTQVAFSADGMTLATGSEDHTVKLWNVVTQREMITFRHQTSPIFGIQFSSDGRMLATLGRDNKIFFYTAPLLSAVQATPDTSAPGATVPAAPTSGH
jgi:WD40 repeat protein